MRLVQLIDTSEDVNNAVSINGCWIYDYNYKIVLALIKNFLDFVFSPSKDKKGMYAEFKDVYYAVRYINAESKSANTEWVNKSLN